MMPVSTSSAAAPVVEEEVVAEPVIEELWKFMLIGFRNLLLLLLLKLNWKSLMHHLKPKLSRKLRDYYLVLILSK